MNDSFKQPKITYFESKAARGTVTRDTLIKDIAGKIERHVWPKDYFKDEHDVSMQLVTMSKPEYDRIAKVLVRLRLLADYDTEPAFTGKLKPIGLRETLDFIAPEVDPTDRPVIDLDIRAAQNMQDIFDSIRMHPGFMKPYEIKIFEAELKPRLDWIDTPWRKEISIPSKHYAVIKDKIYEIEPDGTKTLVRRNPHISASDLIRQTVLRPKQSHYVIARDDFDSPKPGTGRKPKVKVYHPRAPKPEQTTPAFQTLNDYVASEVQKAHAQGKVPSYALFKRMFSTVLTNIVNQDPKAPEVSFKDFVDDTDLVFFTKDGAQVCFYLKFKQDGCHLERSPALTSEALADEAYTFLPKAFAFQVTPNHYYDYDARAEYKGERSKS